MNVIIKSIPQSEQRYATCGDWWYDGDTLHIRVSEGLPRPSQELVVLHEFAEVIMCAGAGITQKQVDDFDMNYEANRKDGDESEPGDSPQAPYFHQHQMATSIEHLAAWKMGVNWEGHEAAITKLFEDTPS